MHNSLLVKEPLVNYAETITSYRSRRQSEWGSYQVLLIGSVFEKLSVQERKVLSESLWQRVFTGQKQFYTSLLMTGIAFPEARLLWSLCPMKLKLRFLATLVRRTLSSLKTMRAKVEKRDAYEFLKNYGISK